MWLLSLLNEQQHGIAPQQAALITCELNEAHTYFLDVEASTRYLLRPGKEYTIGRKDASIVFLDKSVSRRHAVIKVDALPTRSVFKDIPPKLLLSDQKSKYGTFINEKAFEYDLCLNDKDIIRFGSMHSIVRLRWEPITICLPSMRMAEKTALAERAAQLGILLKREWDKDCTHLYMKEVEDTVKFFLCLIDGRPIISAKWFDAIFSMPEGDFSWPSGDYLPPIKDGYDIRPDDCEPNSQRATLFKDLEFLFFDAELFKIYEPIVKAAGGQADMCSSRKTYSIDLLTAENKVIVAPALKNNDGFRKIKDTLQERNCEWIEGQDIGTAIIKCTTSGIRSLSRISQGDNISVSFPGIESQRDQSLPPLPTEVDSPPPMGSLSVHPVGATLDNIFDNLLGDDDDDDILPAPVETRQSAVIATSSVDLEIELDTASKAFTVASPHQSGDQSTSLDLSSPPNSHKQSRVETEFGESLHSINNAADDEDPDVLVTAEASSSAHALANDDGGDGRTAAVHVPRRIVVTESLVKRAQPLLPDGHYAGGVNTKRFKKGRLAMNSQTSLHLVAMHDDRDSAGRRSPGRREDEDEEDDNQTNEVSEFADILIRVNRVRPGRRSQHA